MSLSLNYFNLWAMKITSIIQTTNFCTSSYASKILSIIMFSRSNNREMIKDEIVFSNNQSSRLTQWKLNICDTQTTSNVKLSIYTFRIYPDNQWKFYVGPKRLPLRFIRIVRLRYLSLCSSILVEGINYSYSHQLIK